MMYDYLFVLTEYSENEGEFILVETTSIGEAYRSLMQTHGFREEELSFIRRMSVEEGEMYGFDTY